MSNAAGLNRRRVMGLIAVAGAAAAQVPALAQVPNAARVPNAASRSADDELQLARQGRLRDAQRVAMVKLPQNVEPAFRFQA